MGRNHYNGLGGFSSHASSMISSLKSNFRKKELNLLKGSKTKSTYKKKDFNKKATPKQLKEIRKKIQHENRIISIKKIILFLLISILIIYAIGFVKF